MKGHDNTVIVRLGGTALLTKKLACIALYLKIVNIL